MSSKREIVAGAFLHPFGARFSRDDPFRPVNIRAIYDDEDGETGRDLGVADELHHGRGPRAQE